MTASSFNPLRRGLGILAAVVALAVTGCGSDKKAEDAPPKALSNHFAIAIGGHSAQLQIAVLPAELEHGLMQRPDLGKNEGMVFVFDKPQKQHFWMRNTPEPLDVAYLDPDGVIEEIYPLYPFNLRAVDSRSDDLQFAVEMPQGWYADNAVRPGAKLDLAALSDAVKARGFDPAKFKLK